MIMALLGGCFQTELKAQDKVEAEVAADVVNQYIWRGQELGNTGVQPSLSVSYKGLSVSAWGNVGLTNPDDTKEFDLTLSYSVGGLSLGVTDYWFNTAHKYFSYKEGQSSHIYETWAGYDFGPLNLTWFTNFAGDDGVNKDGKRAYSTYLECNVPFKLGGLEWNTTAAVVPHATSLYGTTGFSVVNLGVKATKEISISDKFSLPVFAGITTNPCAEKAYLVFGVTIQ